MTAPEERASDLQRALAEAERARAAALARLEELQEQRHNERREEQHDLRNLLAVVRAIARRSSEGAHTVEEYCGVLDGRLSAYLHVQAMIARDRPRGVDLLTLLADELLRFDIRVGDDVDLHGLPVQLTGRTAGLMALAFHELASELILTGHPDHHRDRLRVAWEIDRSEPEMLVIDWSTIGPHDVEASPSRWSLWVAQAIRHQLAGTAERHVDAETTTVEIRLPASCWRLAESPVGMEDRSEGLLSRRAADAAFR